MAWPEERLPRITYTPNVVHEYCKSEGSSPRVLYALARPHAKVN